MDAGELTNSERYATRRAGYWAVDAVSVGGSLLMILRMSGSVAPLGIGDCDDDDGVMMQLVGNDIRKAGTGTS